MQEEQLNAQGEEREDREERIRLARVEELCRRAVRGETVSTRFLTPRQARQILLHLERIGEAERARFYGGYAGAERVCLFLFPDYVKDLTGEAEWGTMAVPELLSLVGMEDPLCALEIRGSGYVSLTHRDYLGALLALGVEREVLGDLLVGACRAKVICQQHISDFLLENLEKVAKDVVKVTRATLPQEGELPNRFAPVSDTIASARLDCVVAALANLSREAAQTLIRQGMVELDYETEERVDASVGAPSVLSVRGVGKFAVRAIGDPTRKGRLRLTADKYL